MNQSGDPVQVIACLRGLAAVGAEEDRTKLTPFFSPAEAATTRTFLMISQNFAGASKDLMAEPSEYRVCVIVAYSLARAEPSIWPILEPLLRNDNENIRRLTCYYAVCAFKQHRLRKLLEDYTSEGYYFYNVVTLIDRIVYAPAPIRRKFLLDERDFLNRWHSRCLLELAVDRSPGFVKPGDQKLSAARCEWIRFISFTLATEGLNATDWTAFDAAGPGEPEVQPFFVPGLICTAQAPTNQPSYQRPRQ